MENERLRRENEELRREVVKREKADRGSTAATGAAEAELYELFQATVLGRIGPASRDGAAASTTANGNQAPSRATQGITEDGFPRPR